VDGITATEKLSIDRGFTLDGTEPAEARHFLTSESKSIGLRQAEFLWHSLTRDLMIADDANHFDQAAQKDG
jgi:hypothetical protein